MTQTIDLEELKRIYAEPSYGYTDAELADRFGTTRSAIYKARKRLEDSGIEFIQTERGRYRIDRRRFVSNIRVSTPEALVLYVAARKLSRHTGFTHKHVQNALDKLSYALYQPMTEKLVKAVGVLPQRADADKREQVLETIIRAWTENSKVRIWYRALRSTHTLVHGVSPYLIEPSPWSDSVYLIGYSDVMEKIVPFKIERVQKAMLTSEPPKACQFNEDELLQFAWGIWQNDREAETVVLRFSGREAVRRLRESIWHPQEKVEEEEDGSVLWQARIAEPREMIPWIRGWGADCEVLEPEWLRETLMGEAKVMAEIYGWHVSSKASGQSSSTIDDFYEG